MEDTVKKEVETMTFIAGQSIPRSRLQTVLDADTLFLTLENEEVLSVNDVDILMEMLQEINRQDLMDKVLYYKGLYFCIHHNMFMTETSQEFDEICVIKRDFESLLTIFRLICI